MTAEWLLLVTGAVAGFWVGRWWPGTGRGRHDARKARRGAEALPAEMTSSGSVLQESHQPAAIVQCPHSNLRIDAIKTHSRPCNRTCSETLINGSWCAIRLRSVCRSLTCPSSVRCVCLPRGRFGNACRTVGHSVAA